MFGDLLSGLGSAIGTGASAIGSGVTSLFGSVGDTLSKQSAGDILGGAGKIGSAIGQYTSERDAREADEKRFNKLFDFDARQVARTNRLEDQRQKSINQVFNQPNKLYEV